MKKSIKKSCQNSKKRNLSIISFLILLSIFISNAPIVSSAESTDNSISSDGTVNLEENKLSFSEAHTVEDLVGELFDNKEVQRSEYLYNLDESADYVYVELKDGGYAVFLKERMELLEYSAQGKLNYPETKGKKYYGGPSTYLFKENDYFVDTMTNESFLVTKESAQKYAREVREMLSQNNEAKGTEESLSFDYSTVGTVYSLTENSNIATGGNGPPYDDEDLIHISSGTYIPNYRYFLYEPLHGQNEGKTCGAVATQLLLSYHNYYSDRRIIAEKYLNGSASDPNKSPKYCSDPMLMYSYTLGTRGYYEDGRDDSNSYFAYVVKNIPRSTSFNRLKRGIEDILEFRNSELIENNSSINYNILSEFESMLYPVDSSGVIQNLNAGRPSIVLLQWTLGASNHYVVAYGYCNYSYNGESYLGYITHFGWKSSSETFTNIWVNSSWCAGYVSLEINHTHNYYKVGSISGSDRSEYKCSTCGHRTDAGIGMTAINHYVECIVNIPANIDTYKDIYVTFATSGYKLFQTFGNKDTQMYLFDKEYNQLAYDDDSGRGTKSLFGYNVQANTPYIVRVKLYVPSTNQESIKLGITPSLAQYSEFEDIWTQTGTDVFYYTSNLLNKTAVMVFKPTVSGSYTFSTNYSGDVRVDMYMYVIYHDTAEPCVKDDDSGGDLQASITMDLIANKPYVIIVAPYNITTTEASFYLYINKN